MLNYKKICKNINETYALAVEVACKLNGGEVIILNGNLGAGKTTFTKGLALALGIARTVTSPTFTIMHEYKEGRLTLYHFDMYRLLSADDIEELGLEDLLYENGVCVIEWNKFTKLPPNIITIDISRIDDDTRLFEITANYEVNL